MLARENVDHKVESGFRKEKAEISPLVIQYAIALSPLMTQGQTDLLKTLVSSALETDTEFIFTEPNLRHFCKTTNFIRKKFKTCPLLCERMMLRLLFKVLMT